MKVNIKINDIDKFLDSVEFEESLSNVNDLFNYVNKIKANPFVEIKMESNARTSQQNRALHKLFSIIADMLNDLGMQFNYTGVSGRDFETKYNSGIVKDYFWRPLQVHLTGKQSTAELTTQEMNEIFNVICTFFSDRGHELYFPSNDWLEFKKWYEENRYNK